MMKMTITMMMMDFRTRAMRTMKTHLLLQLLLLWKLSGLPQHLVAASAHDQLKAAALHPLLLLLLLLVSALLAQRPLWARRRASMLRMTRMLHLCHLPMHLPLPLPRHRRQ